MKFILTIDTEGDNQWDHGCELSVNNIRYIPRFQDLCNKYLIKPTYLITTEVCEDAFAKEIFTDYVLSNTAEIGAHLHSWTTPPFPDKDGYRNNGNDHVFANELPQELVTEKIKNLTNHIETSFGKRPLSFRSGRYGFDENVARILAENGYLVDSSVTPFMNWSANEGIPGNPGGPDFIEKSPFPYKYTFGEKSLLEIPITILPTKFPLNKNHKLARYYFREVNGNILFKVMRKLAFNNQPYWFRPYSWMSNKMFDELLNEAIRLKLPYIVMMFHSSELMPGCSIYRKDQNDIEKLYAQLEDFFELLKSKNISSITLTESTKDIEL